MVAEANDRDEADSEPEDPLRAAYRRLRVWQWLAIATVVIACGLLGLAMVLAWQGTRLAQQALHELPEYQVLALTRDYETTVAALESSYQATQDRLKSEPARRVLAQARQLPERLLELEQAHRHDLQAYGDVVALAAANIPGSREWRRHFRGQLQALVTASQAREAALEAQLARYPAVPEAPPSAE